MRYFHKAMISNPAFTQSGERIMFEHVGGDDGIIATDSQNVIDSLLERIRLRKGGVSELTEEKYKELQKKKSASPLPQRQRSRQGVVPLAVLPQDPMQSMFQPPAAPVAVESVKAPVPASPSEPSRPQVGRLKK